MIAAFCLEDIAIQEIYVNSNLIMSNLNTREEAEGGRERDTGIVHMPPLIKTSPLPPLRPGYPGAEAAF